MAHQHIIIIGAGIIGALIARTLAQTGNKVTLIDALDAPGQGVSAASFGWITCAAGDPDIAEPVYRQRLEAIENYAALDRDYRGNLCAPLSGALVWGDSKSETIDWAERHAQRGSVVRLVRRAEIADLEPLLANPPELAACFPNEKALDVSHACSLFTGSARENGADLLFGQKVLGLDVSHGRITGVRLSGLTITADQVIVAAGASSAQILGDLMPDHGIYTSPAALITLSVDTGRIHHVLDGDGIEIRSRRDGSLIAASGLREGDIDAVRAELAGEVLAGVRRLLPGLENPHVTSVHIARRPFIPEGQSLVSTSRNIQGLHLAVAHPGVILAPKISRLVAERTTQ